MALVITMILIDTWSRKATAMKIGPASGTAAEAVSPRP
jgi:hypothetical protein